MVCGGTSGAGSGTANVDCVCALLKRIADAQDEVSPITGGNCQVSCENSINNLGVVSPATNGRTDTVPLVLYCGCEPFLGTGFRTEEVGNSGKLKLDCIQTFFFRVNDVDTANCCASLELLITDKDVNTNQGPCSQIRGNTELTTFKHTNVCITVDLNCFCGATCLDAVLLQPFSQGDV